MAINSDKYVEINSAFFGVVSRSVASSSDPEPTPPTPPIELGNFVWHEQYLWG